MAFLNNSTFILATFGAGIPTTINPCSFAILPVYISYFPAGDKWAKSENSYRIKITSNIRMEDVKELTTKDIGQRQVKKMVMPYHILRSIIKTFVSDSFSEPIFLWIYIQKIN